MEAYPVPSLRSEFPLEEVSVEDLSSVMDKEGAKSGKDYLVVDVRRADCLVSLLLKKKKKTGETGMLLIL